MLRKRLVSRTLFLDYAKYVIRATTVLRKSNGDPLRLVRRASLALTARSASGAPTSREIPARYPRWDTVIWLHMAFWL